MGDGGAGKGLPIGSTHPPSRESEEETTGDEKPAQGRRTNDSPQKRGSRIEVGVRNHGNFLGGGERECPGEVEEDDQGFLGHGTPRNAFPPLPTSRQDVIFIFPTFSSGCNGK